jgi:hypothetical protein
MMSSELQTLLEFGSRYRNQPDAGVLRRRRSGAPGDSVGRVQGTDTMPRPGLRILGGTGVSRPVALAGAG